MTLTFAAEVPDGPAHQAFHRWARRLSRDLYRSHLTIAWSYEAQARGVLHFHALLAPHVDAAEVSAEQIAGAWPYAHRVPVEGVYDAKGAARYLVKHAAWNLNVACDRRPRCRRDGCVNAPGPWAAT